MLMLTSAIKVALQLDPHIRGARLQTRQAQDAMRGLLRSSEGGGPVANP
jgi:hypothetical protein